MMNFEDKKKQENQQANDIAGQIGNALTVIFTKFKQTISTIINQLIVYN